MATPPMLRPRDPWAGPPGPSRPDPVAFIAVTLLVLSAAGLILGGILAVYDWTTPGALRPLFYGVLATFFAALGVELLASGIRHLRAGLR